ncbi:uncharacterized protein LOC107633084 [Arachis ipaensis]|uniref:uncharacterized protein LOC107633084 n=1 Tax=Arachis ipaensis TaxID=130454 RepID=UPI0007AF91DF|nr:uncharacterized protein LOC107633084 [Arachis ipaensis]
MSTRGRERGRGRGGLGNAMPEATGNIPNPVDFMAALGNMAAAMQATAEALGNQINNGNNGNNGDDDPLTLSSFLKAQQVPEEQWVEFETYQLQGEAQHWWQGMRRILQPDGCIKYEGGLRSHILSFVAPIEIRTFSKLVNKTRVTEECLRKAALDKSDHRSSVREDHGRNLAPRGQYFKRGGNTPQQHQGQGSFRRFNNNNNQGKGCEKQAQFPQDDLTCRSCGRYHPNTPCRAGWDVCYYCGGARHMSWNCPEKKSQEARRAPQAGQAYTMRADGAEGTDAPIRGNDELVIKIWTALHDGDL